MEGGRRPGGVRQPVHGRDRCGYVHYSEEQVHQDRPKGTPGTKNALSCRTLNAGVVKPKKQRQSGFNFLPRNQGRECLHPCGGGRLCMNPNMWDAGMLHMYVVYVQVQVTHSH